jgi:uncharacterized surface protein with fasciclin (FAS1) repeats
LLLVVSFSECRKKAFDAYYGRPENLAAPIYQQLDAKGNFKNLLACIDKAGYKETLSAAGYWTMFAPNDNAFKAFFTQRGINDISQLDSGTCKQIVTYSLVYNAFVKARLGDYQANTGWVANAAFRRRTANYQGYYNDTTVTGQKVKALANNRNGGYVIGDNNNKYIPYFVDNFLSNSRLSASDYSYFFPNVTYTGFNVVDATVVTQDIVAENGFIHEIDKVLLPLPNLDQYLASNPQYSEFKKLFDKYMVQYVLNQDATTRYKLLTGASDNVYIKTYNAALAFSANNENFLKLQDNDGQANSWTMFVPKNDVLLDYINTVILENYRSLDQLPIQIIVDFLNAHLFATAVWPSKFSSSINSQAEPAKFNPSTDIIDRKILSNGIFYGTNKVQQANLFSTVYGKAYLDPKYLLMTRLLDLNLKYTITVPTVKYTVIMMSDSVLRSYGYDYNTLQSQFQYTVPRTTNTTVSTAVRDNLLRMLATHIIPTPNGELDNLSGSGIVETLNGEYIKFSQNKLTSAGSQDSGYTVSVSGMKNALNGRVYYADNLLTFSRKTIGNTIVALGSATTSPFNYFYQYLKSSPVFNATTGDILGVSPGVFYTVFIPNNAAIQAAVNAGLLPGTGTGAVKTPNFAPTTQADIALVTNFIQYHILNKNTVVPDGKKSGTYETLYKKLTGDPGTVLLNNIPNSLAITDNFARRANVVLSSSNNLADRCVIHLIDNYLQYNPN